MPSCKYCGKPVTSGIVCHAECAGGMRWIDPKQRSPTKEDANEAGMILAVLKSDGYATAWWWSSVARRVQLFSGWMPLPEPPREEVDPDASTQ